MSKRVTQLKTESSQLRTAALLNFAAMKGDFCTAFGEAAKRPTAANGEEPSQVALEEPKEAGGGEGEY